MKFLLSMILAIAVLGASVYHLLGRLGGTGEQQTVLPSGLSKNQSDAAEEENATAKTQTGTLYRWRDADGTVHIESSPPPAGVEFEAITYQGQTGETNADAAPQTTINSSADAQEKRLDPPLSVYTPEGINELMDQVDQTAKQMGERDKLLEVLQDDL